MSRKGNIPKRDILPDPVYGSVAVAKLINSIMLDGKKGTAQAIVYGAFDRIKEQTGEEPLEVFEQHHACTGSKSQKDRRSQLSGSCRSKA